MNGNYGALYIFYRNLGGTEFWGQLLKLVSPNSQPFGSFASSVSVSGIHLLVGAHGENSYKGTVYHFQQNLPGADQWGHDTSFTISNTTYTYTQLANTVLAKGQYAAVSGSESGNYGQMFMLQTTSGNSYSIMANIQDQSPPFGHTNPNDAFGSAFSMDPTHTIVGADGNTGSAYSLTMPPAPPTPNNNAAKYTTYIIIGGAAIVVIVAAVIVGTCACRRKAKPASGQ